MTSRGVCWSWTSTPSIHIDLPKFCKLMFSTTLISKHKRLQLLILNLAHSEGKRLIAGHVLCAVDSLFERIVVSSIVIFHATPSCQEKVIDGATSYWNMPLLRFLN